MHPLRSRIQAEVVKRTKLPASTVSLIFTGKRKATPSQAAALEAVLIEFGYGITRWDMLYRYQSGQKLLDLDKSRKPNPTKKEENK